MANEGPRTAGGGTNILIVGVSVLMVVALMAWLVMQQQNRAEATVSTVDSTAVAPDAGGAAPTQTVNDTVFEQNVKSYVGQVVELTGVRFSSALSSQTFWVELPSGAPFLIKLDSALVAAGTTPPSGGVLHVIGTVQQKDAALVGQWRQGGVLQTDDQQMQAEFGTTYMEARQIRPAGR